MMRILFDMQGTQTPGSKHRGVGRYSHALLEELIKQRPDWEFHLLLNNVFTESSIEIRKRYNASIPDNHIHIWHAVEHCRDADTTGHWRRQVSIAIRDQSIERISPDVLINTSMFEGFLDDAIITVSDEKRWLVVSILYDLIPLVFKEQYLINNNFSKWYYKCLAHLKRSDLLLSISEASKIDAIQYADFSKDHVVSINGAADPVFHVQSFGVDKLQKEAVKVKFGIKGRFVLYTGGNERRKNIDFLIKSFRSAQISLSEHVELVIVCNIDGESKSRLLRQSGLKSSPTDIVFTGFVSESDLVSLYSTCDLFVFPSLYEGLGLPILEAAGCGAPIISSKSSSMTEIVDMDEALFDPYDIKSCTSVMYRALSEPTFLQSLKNNSNMITSRYKWSKTALQAAAAIEHALSLRTQPVAASNSLNRRKKIAHVSPFSPLKTGVADYSSEISFPLAKVFQVDIVSEQHEIDDSQVLQSGEVIEFSDFVKTAWKYDHVLYHIGNSHFHWEYLKNTIVNPGTVIIHDAYLSGVTRHMSSHKGDPTIWFKALRNSHGLAKAILLYTDSEWDKINLHDEYPVSFDALDHSSSVVLHSSYAHGLLKDFYGEAITKKVETLVFPRAMPLESSRNTAREQLGIPPNDFIVCSFGFVADTKFAEELLSAWFESLTWKTGTSRFYFVGMCGDAAMHARIKQKIERNNAIGRVVVTGFVSSGTYKQFLQAANVAIQLRRFSRGETSATVADCLAFGVPTIVNSNGSLAEIQDNTALKLSDSFDDHELVDAIDLMYKDVDLRSRLTENGKEFIRNNADPYAFVKSLANTMASPNASNSYWRNELVKGILKLTGDTCSAFDAEVISSAIGLSFPPETARHRIILDISFVMSESCIGSSSYSEVSTLLADMLIKGDSIHSYDLIALSEADMAVSLGMLKGALLNIDLPAFSLKTTLAPTDTIYFPISSTIMESNRFILENAVASGTSIIAFASRSMLLQLLNGGISVLYMLRVLVSLCDRFFIEDTESYAMLEFLLEAAQADERAKIHVCLIGSKSSSFIENVSSMIKGHSFPEDYIVSKLWAPSKARRLSIISNDIRIGHGSRFGQYAVSERSPGHFTFGPYIDLEPGKYRLKIIGRSSNVSGCFVELLYNNNFETIIAKKNLIQPSEENDILTEIDFDLDFKVKNFEARVSVSKETIIIISAYDLQRF